MTIRVYQPGDEAAQVAIYNEAAGDLPKFKPVTLDEMRRRCHAADFDPNSRLYALDKGRAVGYITVHANGRMSYPWCLKGHEAWAEPLFEQGLQALGQLGVKKAFAAYRTDWTPPKDFFLGHGFPLAREMVNFVLDLVEMPTQRGKHLMPVSPLQRADIPTVLQMLPSVQRLASAAELEKYLCDNPLFRMDAVYAVRSRSDNTPAAVGLLIDNPAYSDPKMMDSAMPCFRLGAFGTEGQQTKKINGLFSFIVKDGPDFMPHSLQLMEHAAYRLESSNTNSLAGQVPSDAPHLLRFYKNHFRRQGSFPIYERAL